MSTQYHNCQYAPELSALADLFRGEFDTPLLGAEPGQEPLGGAAGQACEHATPAPDEASEAHQSRAPYQRLSAAEEKRFASEINSCFNQACQLIIGLKQPTSRLRSLQADIKSWANEHGHLVPQKRRIQGIRKVLDCTPLSCHQQINHLLAQVDQAATELILGNLALVEIISLKYLNKGIGKEDLMQEGNVGLVKAAYRFDASKAAFATYASFWIRQCMGKAIIEQSRTIRLPAHLHEQRNRFFKFYHQLLNENGQPPADQEVARRAEVPLHVVKRFRTSPPTSYLDAPVAGDAEISLGDLLSDERQTAVDELCCHRESQQVIEEVFQELNPKEAEVLRMRYGLGNFDALTLCEIGKRFGVSRERVRQIEKKALDRLRHPVRRHKLEFLRQQK